MSGERLGELLESSDTLPLLQAQALDTSLNPTLFENRKAEGEAGWGYASPCSSPDPHRPAEARELGRASTDLLGRARADGAWTREDGTHVDSVASGGIWGSQGAGAPHEIHAAFKVSVWGWWERAEKQPLGGGDT